MKVPRYSSEELRKKRSSVSSVGRAVKPNGESGWDWRLAKEKPPDGEEILIWCSESRELFVGFISSHNQENKPKIYSHLIKGTWELDELTKWRYIKSPDVTRNCQYIYVEDSHGHWWYETKCDNRYGYEIENFKYCPFCGKLLIR